MTAKDSLIDALIQAQDWVSRYVQPSKLSWNMEVAEWWFSPNKTKQATRISPRDTAHAQLEFLESHKRIVNDIRQALKGMGAFRAGLGEWSIRAEMTEKGTVVFAPRIARQGLRSGKGTKQALAVNPRATADVLERAIDMLSQVKMDRTRKRSIYLIGNERILAPNARAATAIFLAANQPHRLRDILSGAQVKPASLDIFRLESSSAEDLLASSLLAKTSGSAIP